MKLLVIVGLLISFNMFGAPKDVCTFFKYVKKDTQNYKKFKNKAYTGKVDFISRKLHSDFFQLVKSPEYFCDNLSNKYVNSYSKIEKSLNRCSSNSFICKCYKEFVKGDKLSDICFPNKCDNVNCGSNSSCNKNTGSCDCEIGYAKGNNNLCIKEKKQAGYCFDKKLYFIVKQLKLACNGPGGCTVESLRLDKKDFKYLISTLYREELVVPLFFYSGKTSLNGVANSKTKYIKKLKRLRSTINNSEYKNIFIFGKASKDNFKGNDTLSIERSETAEDLLRDVVKYKKKPFVYQSVKNILNEDTYEEELLYAFDFNKSDRGIKSIYSENIKNNSSDFYGMVNQSVWIISYNCKDGLYPYTYKNVKKYISEFYDQVSRKTLKVPFICKPSKNIEYSCPSNMYCSDFFCKYR